MKDYFFGDIHFSAMNIWNIEVGNRFVNWFINTFSVENHKQDTCLFAGDVTDKDTNPGRVIDQVYQLFEFCNKTFKKTIVIMGNHDKKLYRGHEQNSLIFLNRFDNVEVIEDVCQVEIEPNKTVLMMPHIRTEGVSINDYYNTFNFETQFSRSDVAFGHWTIQDENSIMYKNGVDTSRIPADTIICGHIHDRPRPEYLGSVYPCNPLQQVCKYPRIYKIWNEDKTFTDVPLPNLLVYEDIDYPNPIDPEKNKDAIRLFTVYGASSKEEAQKFYSRWYIKSAVRATQQELQEAEDFTKEKELVKLFKSNTEALNAMIKEEGLVISRAAYAILQDALADHI